MSLATITAENTAPSPSAPDSTSQIELDRWDILHWAKVSFRYHLKRQWFFNVCDLTTQFICALAGFAVFSKFFTDVWVAGAVVTALSLLAMLVRYSDCKQRHIDLGRRCQHLIAEIEASPIAKVTATKLAAWSLVRAQINGDEPPTIRTLASLCEWEQCKEDGWPDHAPKLTLWQRIHRHFW